MTAQINNDMYWQSPQQQKNNWQIKKPSFSSIKDIKSPSRRYSKNRKITKLQKTKVSAAATFAKAIEMLERPQQHHFTQSITASERELEMKLLISSLNHWKNFIIIRAASVVMKCRSIVRDEAEPSVTLETATVIDNSLDQ